jgi:hypothetical protein
MSRLRQCNPRAEKPTPRRSKSGLLAVFVTIHLWYIFINIALITTKRASNCRASALF